MFWVEFKYESLPTLCFYCGILGHMEKSCDRKIQDSKEAKLCEGQYGEWMRVQGRLLSRQEGRSDGVKGKQVALGKELVVGEQAQRQQPERVEGIIEVKGDAPVRKVSVGEGDECSHGTLVGSLDREILGGGEQVDFPISAEEKQQPSLGASKQETGQGGGEVMELDGFPESVLPVRSGLTVLDQNRIGEDGERRAGTSVLPRAAGNALVGSVP